MTRIVAGAARGRRLAVPAGTQTRPTSDRAREALFSTLESMRTPLTGGRVLDVYAGSGALGLEALSRGAGSVLFVESAPAVVRVLEANVATVGLAGATVLSDRVERALARRNEGSPYDVLLADPPYAVVGHDLRELFGGLPNLGWLAGDSVVVVERSSRDPDFDWPAGWAGRRARRYGEATLWYGRPG